MSVMHGGDGEQESRHPDDVENLAPRCSVCDDCEARRDEVSAGVQSWEHIPLLETAREVTNFEGRTDTDEVHSADTDGILAHYALSEEVACSLKGRHLHRKGLVVRTLCEIVLCMGFNCGAKSIIGFEQLQVEYRRRTSFQQDVNYLGGWAGEFERRVAELRPRLNAIRETASLLVARLPQLVQALQARKRTGNLEVHLPAGAGTERLRGIGILDADKHDPRKLNEILSLFRRQLSEHPPIDGSTASTLLRRAREGNRAADAMDAWLREASEFVSERNLNVALVVLNSDGKVTATSEGVRVKYFGAAETLLRYLR